MSCTTSWPPWATPARSAPPAAPSPRPKRHIAPGAAGSTGPGCPSPACGPSSTGATAPCRGCAHLVVLRLAGLEPLPGRAGHHRQAVPTLIACLDQCLRRFGGVPTYALTDNEKTVTTDIVARVPVRHPELVKMGRHYGLSIATCVVADPESKGGSEATVRIAEADLVPTEANLLAAYKSFGELAAACEAFCDQVNARAHRATRHVPAEMLAEERHEVAPLARTAPTPPCSGFPAPSGPTPR